ncbi:MULTISPECIES: hypothetical protein [unclassified Caballeronia]|uniref:hypothetical protein n=1 Tax=unclassified Caballeronia TaxID=2646786 RepID=UPI001F49F173|nr:MULTISPECIES: hypothetical protein [unclassified Caballeronia]
MRELWAFALRYPALLIVPAIGFVLSLVVLRIKTRYVNEGVLFGRSRGSPPEGQGSDTVEEEDTRAENHIDLTVALRKIHELALADGDLRYAYWHEIGQLLQRANRMQAEIDSLSEELERCRAMLSRAK